MSECSIFGIGFLLENDFEELGELGRGYYRVFGLLGDFGDEGLRWSKIKNLL